MHVSGPGLLIASPQMRDPNFSGAVVLLWHYDSRGAMGVVINRATDFTVSQVLEHLDLEAQDYDGTEQRQVLWGGPVEQGAGYLLFRGQVDEDAGWNVDDGIAVTTSQGLLEQQLAGDGDYTLCMGYAGWAPGQLDREIETGSWLYTEIDGGLLFDAPLEDRYERALASLGLTADQVWMTPIDE